ncbi:WYL domain-containing protein [Weeksellaceae bacterium TAE3-ERU29]|nr:WYL domain-containing protein [Weeksellaceae bacterium TAE3-ERU29]
MSKIESIARYNLIIKKLRKHPASFNEISDYLDLESDLHDYNYRVSKRTFQRDLKDIRTLYGVDVQYNRAKKVYYVNLNEQEEVNERILEAFDIFNALNISDRLSNYIHFEKRKPKGTENLHGFLHAIKNQLQIKFEYQKFWEEEPTERVVEPYALKEFKNRWYLLANDLKACKVKSFALDRLADLDITKRKFDKPKDFDVNKYYKYCFGIISPNDYKPKEIILSFKPFQGKYIKTLPLHESQEILVDNDNELRIKLKLFITHDFLMELLSYGDTLRVLEPECLIKDLRDNLKRALMSYE